MIVLKLPGWQDSKGVTAEIAYAKELDLPIEWMESTEEKFLVPSEADSSPFKDLLSRMLNFYSEREWSQISFSKKSIDES